MMLYLRGLVTALAIACGYVALIVAVGLLSLPVRADEPSPCSESCPAANTPEAYACELRVEQACREWREQKAALGDITSDAIACCDDGRCVVGRVLAPGGGPPPETYCETRCVEWDRDPADPCGQCSEDSSICTSEACFVVAKCTKLVEFCGTVKP